MSIDISTLVENDDYKIGFRSGKLGSAWSGVMIYFRLLYKTQPLRAFSMQESRLARIAEQSLQKSQQKNDRSSAHNSKGDLNHAILRSKHFAKLNAGK